MLQVAQLEGKPATHQQAGCEPLAHAFHALREAALVGVLGESDLPRLCPRVCQQRRRLPAVRR